MGIEPIETPPEQLREDIRSGRPYLLSRSPLKTFGRRVLSIAALVAVDLAGLTIGLYLALVARSLVRDPSVSWSQLWDQERDWLAFLMLLLLLVFWRNHLYGARELREGAGRIVPSVLLVAALALAFAVGTGQHFTTFGLYVVGAIFVAALISLFRWICETATGALLRSLGARRRVLLVGSHDQVVHLRNTLGERRSGIDYEFIGEISLGPGVRPLLNTPALDEVIVADGGLDDEEELLALVEAAHRRGVRVRIAPRTTELLIERGEYVPGQAVPLFELRAPILAGTDWAVKRTFDIVVAGLVVLLGLPLWLLIAAAIKLTSRGPVIYAAPRVGLGERTFRMFKFRTMIAEAAQAQAALESSNEASGALFKIRNDPRVTPVGRVLRRFSIDEVPNVLNVLRGEMSLVGPRPLPLRDYDRLEPWHRRRSNILPGMTGLWQIAGRSDLSFDDLVRLDFQYLENWSLWLDITILLKTLPAVLSRRGAY